MEGQMSTFQERLRHLVGIDTGADNPAGRDEAAATIAEWARLIGCTSELVPGQEGMHVVASLEGGGEARIILLCHHDTVFPVGTAAARPFEVREDRAFGPGVADMKGGIVLALMSMAYLSARARPFASLELHSVPDEEPRGVPFATLDRVRGADAALVLECGRENGDVVVGRKVGCWLRMTASGRSAHAGTHPEEGRSAVLALCREVLRCDEMNDLREGLTVVAGTIAGGTSPNVVPDSAEARFDIRAVNSEDRAWAVTEMANHLPYDGVSLAVEQGDAWPGIEPTPAGDTLFSEARRLGLAVGMTVGGQISGGASDGCFTAQAGIPTLDGLGPVGGFDHSPDEYLLLSSVSGRCGVLAGLIESVGRGLLDEGAG
jgi:glutamate carboxypeptidase